MVVGNSKLVFIQKELKKVFGFESKFLAPHQLRVTDGDKRIDLYPTRYHKIETGQRGDYTEFYVLCENYFLRDE